jgi:hypothetical protein
LAFSRLAVEHADEVLDFGDHPTRCGRIRQLGDPVDAIEAEADQGLSLVESPP